VGVYDLGFRVKGLGIVGVKGIEVFFWVLGVQDFRSWGLGYGK
jgi:hypothetical protein